MATEFPTPTEPGFYWRWMPPAHPGDPTSLDIQWVGRRECDGQLGIYGSGYFMPITQPSRWKWGPRVPDWTPES